MDGQCASLTVYADAETAIKCTHIQMVVLMSLPILAFLFDFCNDKINTENDFIMYNEYGAVLTQRHIA